jgi:hypothetical protein
MKYLYLFEPGIQIFNHIRKIPGTLIFSVACAVSFYLYNYIFLFSLTAASDPFQYVEPALNPEGGFPYLDRVVLWVWIRCVSVLPISPEEVGGVATLLASSFTLLIISWFLARRYNLLTSGLFTFLYSMSPTILGIASYTYPMQVLTLVLACTLVLMSVVKKHNTSMFIGGVGAVLLVLSKIQGGSFFIFLIIYSLVNFKNIHQFISGGVYALLGAILAFVSIFSSLIVIDGLDITLSIFQQYFSGNAGTQFTGRGEGGFPPFYVYLFEPTAILVFLGILIPFSRIGRNDKVLRLWSLAAFCQLTGLLAIYLFTQRGGPVISNYFLDSYVIGLATISILVSSAFKHLKYQGLFALFILIVTGLILIYWFYATDYVNSVYTPLYLLSDINLMIMGGIFWLFSCLVFVAFLYRKHIIIYLSLIPVIALVGFRAEEGIKDAKYRIKFNSGYHKVAKYLSHQNFDKKIVWISMKFNRYNIDVSSRKLKSIYDTFYQSNNTYLFSEKEPSKYDILLTNRNDKYQKHGISSYVSIKSIYKLDEIINLKSVNDYRLFDFRLGGLVGEGAVRKILNNKQIMLELNLDAKAKNLVQLDFSDGRIKDVESDKALFISSTKLEVNPLFLIRMYAQYFFDNKWKREVFLVRNNVDPGSLSLIIPRGARKISYGWLVTIKDVVHESEQTIVILPNIEYSIEDVVNNGINLGIGKVWMVHK